MNRDPPYNKSGSGGLLFWILSHWINTNKKNLLKNKLLFKSICLITFILTLGLYCNRTWDGWLCWDDTPAGTYTSQNCPNYFPDFDPTGKSKTTSQPWFLLLFVVKSQEHLKKNLYMQFLKWQKNFLILEKAIKYCDETGNWFLHPETNRTWSNYTFCIAYTKVKLKVKKFMASVLSKHLNTN